EARNKAQNKLQNGEALFSFVSPERLMIEKFRNSLASMANESHYFSYGVIDEVHCVSEWGHNFRTPYLSLGRNLIDFCKAEDGDIALFGLTATASFDVLADVQRELSGNRENQMIPDEAVVRYENTNRDELQYHIERVSLKNDQIEELRKQSKGPFFKISLSKAIGILKQHKINEILSDPGALIRRFNVKAENVVQEELLELTYSPENRPTLTLIHDKIKIPERSYQGNFWDYRDEEGNNNAALIFAPHKSWYFGVTDKYRQDDRRLGIAESIKGANILPQEKIGTFLGVDSDHEAVVKRMQEDNDRNQEAFVNGIQQLMVATKAFGMGIDKPNIRLTIHNNFPDSIESFVQEAGRGGRDRKLSVACVLYNDQEVQDPLRDKLYRHDFDLQESFLWNSFKGEEHEKRTLYELLNEIIFPGRDRINQLTKILNEHPDLEKLGYEVWVKHYDVKNRLYINGPEKRDLGYIDYKEGTLIAKWSNVDPEISLMVLEALWSIVQDLAINLNPSFLQDWLNESQGSEKRNGIEKVLDQLKFGDHFEILVPFENDHTEIYNALAELVVKFLEISLTETTTINRYERYCKDHYHVKAEAFLENLNRDLRIIEKLDQLMLSNLDEANGFRRKLQNLLNRRRDKADTEKAIFRFSVIGLIDDYTVDYNSETYILKGIKKFSEQYNEALRFYISKYYSQKRTDKIIDNLSERRGNSHIQKILNFVTDFVYTEVAKKRFESISFMRECCKVGLERGNVDMKTWIHLYFNSKYARKGYSVKIEDEYLVIFSNLPLMQIAAGEYNASLLDWTNEGQEEEFDFVLDFMHLIEFDRSNSERDNLKHLRGACTRFIIANPDNYVFRLLRAFSVLLLEEGNLKDSVKIGVLEDLKRGYINLSERENEEFDLGEAMVHYKAAMNDKLQNLAAKEWFLDILQNLEFLAHVEWTNKFKQRFTNDLVI
ncbi:MAG TPA: helicase-related protein, partial [Sphingobacteriaceae bacterium]|nr:helicase-related protein [Sphingobacteriaceae bacterium]